MPSNDLTISTGTHASSSVGASASDYTTLCAHGPFLQVETEDARAGSGRHLFLPLPWTAGDSSLLLGFHLFGTFAQVDLPKPVVVRLLCHALLQRLPDEALPEAAESLTGMYNFYRRPRTSLPELPAPPPVRAWVTDRYVEPVHPVTEE